MVTKSLNFEPAVLEYLDSARGLVSRSAYVGEVLKEYSIRNNPVHSPFRGEPHRAVHAGMPRAALVADLPDPEDEPERARFEVD
jgi:hypothetical protein